MSARAVYLAAAATLGLALVGTATLLVITSDHEDNKATTIALAVTAGISFTSAAIVMVATFSVFALLPLIDIKEVGIGLAAAVLIDATLIRAVLLPATMKLLGERNWCLPTWPSGSPAFEHELAPKATPALDAA